MQNRLTYIGKKKQPVVTKIEREAGRDKLGVWV